MSTTFSSRSARRNRRRHTTLNPPLTAVVRARSAEYWTTSKLRSKRGADTLGWR